VIAILRGDEGWESGGERGGGEGARVGEVGEMREGVRVWR
jgi:hypothetical protein